MRLIHIETLRIHEFLGPPPPYAILSHTWEQGEVTFHDVSEENADGKPGWLKVTSFCRIVNQYLLEPVEYVWVDTCCIDKSSSAETSEAINSMFRYYQEATYCFVYLVDVVYDSFGELFHTVFVNSRWFTRGWTLQELIAPPELMFFDMNWKYIGTKIDLAAFISEKTKVDIRTLISGDWPGASIARRMSWASTRQTTRPEDMAYCLLGLFGVHMPLIYGEGPKAFVRLQEEILKESDDYSILAWNASELPQNTAV
ncbi:Vegetative incompatibility protein HET-E-1 [Colletotrichum viniferum]|nr:Vegetative incompatibility protein HET-E-1 [Colletotrichum viniferum]